MKKGGVSCKGSNPYCKQNQWKNISLPLSLVSCELICSSLPSQITWMWTPARGWFTIHVQPTYTWHILVWRIPYRADFQDGSYPGSPNTVPLWALTASPTFDLWAGSVPRNMGQQKSEMNNVSSIQLWKEICNKNICVFAVNIYLYMRTWLGKWFS